MFLYINTKLVNEQSTGKCLTLSYKRRKKNPQKSYSAFKGDNKYTCKIDTKTLQVSIKYKLILQTLKLLVFVVYREKGTVYSLKWIIDRECHWNVRKGNTQRSSTHQQKRIYQTEIEFNLMHLPWINGNNGYKIGCFFSLMPYQPSWIV